MTSEPRRSSTSESESHYNLALQKLSRNKCRQALSHLVEALQIAPHNPPYMSYFGYCLAVVEHDYEKAIRFCEQAQNAKPLDPELYINLGKVYRMSGDNEKAHQQFLRGWEVSKRHPGVAAELTRMGIRRPPVLRFLSRSNICNKYLGMVRAIIERRLLRRRAC